MSELLYCCVQTKHKSMGLCHKVLWPYKPERSLILFVANAKLLNNSDVSCLKQIDLTWGLWLVMVLLTSPAVNLKDLIKYNSSDCCVQNSCFHLHCPSYLKEIIIVIIIHEVIPATNISLLKVGIDFTKRL